MIDYVLGMVSSIY